MVAKNSFPDLDFGIIYFPHGKKRNLPFHSCYHSENTYSLLLSEENYSDLLHFLNFDVTPLNESIHTTLMDILNKKSNNIIAKDVTFLTEQLISWHPFFQYNLFFHICDLLITYALECILFDDNVEPEFSLFYFIKRISKSIYTAIYGMNYHFLKEKTTILKNAYCPYPFSARKWGNIDKPTPLGYLEKFQNFLRENLPSSRYDSNYVEWNKFWNNLPNPYKDSISNALIPNIYSKTPDKNEYTETDSVSNTMFFYQLRNDRNKNIHLLETKDRYPIESFPHYILVQLTNLKYNLGAIKFCKNCGKFYFNHSPSNINHTCPKDDYFSSMNKIYDDTYQRIYERAETHLNNQLSSKAKVIDLLKESGFILFHENTFKYALLKHISIDIYEEYTYDENYTFNKYQNLPPLKDLIQTYH